MKKDRDLGFTFFTSPKCGHHIVGGEKKANQVLWMIKRSFKYCSKSIVLKVYKFLVQ